MKLNNLTADIFVPDHQPLPEALRRTTHLAVGAHQDDLEFMAIHGIQECFRQPTLWFTGVTCTNGAGSPRSGLYKDCSDAEMQKIRQREQRQAAVVGEYAAMLQLDYPSSALKDPKNPQVVDDLVQILTLTKPEVVYTHNPADKHPTHVAVFAAVLRALRHLPAEERTMRVYGCEIWRDLDWLPDAEKVILDVSGRTNLAAALSGVFDSQITGGKRYDLAVHGRRQANATFLGSHSVDQAELLTFAMDLTPLIKDPSLNPVDFVAGCLDRFRSEVLGVLNQQFPKT